jgi:hypothetical protein
MSLNLFSLPWRLVLVGLGFSALVAAGQNLTPPLNPASATNALPAVATNGVTTNALAAPELAHTKYVHETIERLVSLEMNSDPASLAAILAEMKNPDKQVRDAALKAVIQFNDRTAVPVLQKLADETADPYEKVDILKAIDYIKLPSFTELMAYKRSLKVASQQTNAPAGLSTGVTNPPPAAAHP